MNFEETSTNFKDTSTWFWWVLSKQPSTISIEVSLSSIHLHLFVFYSFIFMFRRFSRQNVSMSSNKWNIQFCTNFHVFHIKFVDFISIWIAWGGEFDRITFQLFTNKIDTFRLRMSCAQSEMYKSKKKQWFIRSIRFYGDRAFPL